MPVGISGFPGVYDRVRLSNPALFGPGYVPPPHELEMVTAGNNIRLFTLPSEWVCKIWRPALGSRVEPLFAPIILRDWPDVGGANKSHDLLIYDKIHWHRDNMVPRVADALIAHLTARGLTFRCIRYGRHHIDEFRMALRSVRAMAFLSAHETQGLAYQEAMASGIPIFAWDEGKLVDPAERQFAPVGLRVSSVPYFDERCGATFREDNLEQRFDRFWAGMNSYRPRQFVADNLSPEKSARRYLELLDRVG
ncbi:glycosyltransferase [Paracoccus ravus]|uniref:glycosyltransferase n=1 Tax=Paracoccus ravus TaxID=2447760 RepID=UPI00106EAD66|nr:glycosyltransferase [Paracoccus ravus]